MSVSPGAKFGPYEIIAPIGKGGMGEVYRARDTRLNRDVAIKFSSAHFSERFDREARAIAALNHPNICHLYDVGPNYLVMELVEGPTVAERIEHGAIPFDEAVAIAKQIADALEAAHQKGITHRDLKPGNVKIKADGTVKVLDFGLAKMGGTPAAGEDSPTLTMGQTEAGVILGTVAYMAPEQAKGKPVDNRADIWAFGVVLYEMLTGRRLFNGKSAAEVLASVIRAEPEWNRVPAKARPLLRRCLEKDPQRRLRDIGDAMPLLELVPEAAPQSGSRVPWIAWGAAAVLLAVAAAAGLSYRGGRSAPPVQVSRFQIGVPERTVIGAFNISPDGRKLVFAGRLSEEPSGRLYLRSLDSLETHIIPGTENADYPFWSPDSRFVAFGSDGKLRKIDISGGPPEAICDVLASGFYGGSWNRDNTIIFGAIQGVMKVSASGGSPSAVTPLAGVGDRFPSFLPDGRHFAYLRTSNGSPNGAAVLLGSLDAKPEEQNRKPLFASSTAVAYIPSQSEDGKFLFLRNGTLLAQTFDARHEELTGEAEPVTQRVGANGVYAYFSTSANGVLVYRMGANQDFQLTWYDRDGRVLGTPGESRPYTFMTLSPDATRAAVMESGDVWVVDLTRGTKTRLTSDHAASFAPVWSPDGSRLAYSANRGGAYGIYVKSSSGAGGDDLLLKTEGLVAPNHWSPDGRFLLYGPTGQKTGSDLWILPLEGDRKPFPFVATEFTETGGRFSPDGRWIAYRSDESGRNEIYVQPFNPDSNGSASFSGAKWAVSKAGSLGMARWRADGKEMYYLGLTGKIMAVEITTNPTFHVGEPRPLFPVRSEFLVPSTLPGSRVDATADGKRFLFAMSVQQTARDEFNVVLNWPAALAK